MPLWTRALGALFLLLAAGPARAEPTVMLRIVGGLAGVSQYHRFEEPFWREQVPALSGGRLQVSIQPWDRSGIRGQEMLQLMRLGVVPFGTALLAVAAAEEPELNAVDLAVLSLDMATLRRNVAAYRPHIAALLADRYDVELLAIYTYPAQVIFCRQPFAGLSDLAGRRIRTSSVGQSELVAALGSVGVVTGFAEITHALRTNVVDCAITGTLSGNAIGLHEITSHVHDFAINWGLSLFGANRAAWQALPAPLRETLGREIAGLEARIWEAAEQETGEGLACNAGRPGCVQGRRGGMSVVPTGPADEARRIQLLTEIVLPGWVRRCGPECAEAWNSHLAASVGLTVRGE
ncbi:MAG TPA: TRAP transporter substrate-binding protein [Acetobacteraceae bacterium]|nr:TRAP transporter substrate-binding protein [Acetobacteraceae bacterium]